MRVSMMLLAALFASGAQAQVGVTVMANYRFGDELAADGPSVSVDEGSSPALVLHYFTASDSAFDLWLSRFDSSARAGEDRTDVLQESIQFGGRKYWRDAPFLPYVGATVGILRLSPDLRSDERETRPAFSLFTGLALPLSEQVKLLAEARWIGTVFSSDTSLRCDDDACEWTIKSGTWSQYDVGLAISGQF